MMAFSTFKCNDMFSCFFLERALEQFPMLRKDALVGAIVYYDGKVNKLILQLAKEAQNRNLTTD
jgi:hypothetical protein